MKEKETNMKKTVFYAVIFSLISGLLFAGGSGQDRAAGGKREKISILMRTAGADAAYRVWHTALEDFAKEKGLKVEWEMIPGDADYLNKLQLYISSGQLPDIYGCANGTFSKAAKAAGSIVNIGEEFKRIGKFNNVNKAVVDFLTDSDDGQMYLYPEALNCEFFLYRKDIFDKYGLKTPTTWAEFINICKVLKDKGETPVIVGGKENWQLMRYLSFPPWRATHDKFIYGYIDGSETFASNRSAQYGVHLLNLMGNSGYYQRGFTSTDYTDATNLFFGGTGAMFYAGSWLIQNASAMFKEGKLGIFPVPGVEGMTNMSTNIPIHAGFAFAFNAKTYDDTMKEFFSYLVKRYSALCYDAGHFSPFNDPIPSGLDPLYYALQPFYEKAEKSWISWDDKLDSATLTSLVDLQKSLALGMISEGEYVKEADQIIAGNR
jgi:raffinose/stachyose/melibiose transport system substrate-binding protein